MTNNTDLSTIIEDVREVIATNTDHTLEDVMPQSDLDIDLELSDAELANTIHQLAKKYKVELDTELTIEQAETVEELAGLVRDEILLG